jgi:hypothetical protein
MPVEPVPGTNLTYYLIAFDASGRERTEGAGERLSRRVVDLLTREPITDVFLMSHGWKGDVPAARDQYERWIGAMSWCDDDVARMRQARPGFRPLLIGLHWPSLPYGDESLSGSVSFATGGDPIEVLIDQAAEGIADTPAARAALRTVFNAAGEDVAPPTLPPEVRAAYRVLDREAALGDEGVAGAPGADREPFDPERFYQAALEDPVSFGIFGTGGILSLLQQLSFWKMKDRARRIGETGGFELLTDLQRAAPAERNLRFHLMGHSFGCIVMSATLAGPGGRGTLVRPVDSVALVQGALSLWSYCSEIPMAQGRAGYFAAVVAGRKVAGPVITTQSEFDTAVGRLYPWAAGVARQVVFALGELPKYGAVGAFGIRGPGPDVVDLEMQPAGHAYEFAPGKVYNLQSSRYVREGGGLSGAHSDIAHPEVAHAVWQAARPR